MHKEMKMKKQTLLVIFGVAMGAFGCTFTVGTPIAITPVDEVSTVVSATMQALTASPEGSGPTQAATQPDGNSISFENVSFVIPDGLASGADTEKITAVDTNSGAPWEVAPTHLRFTLRDYPLQGKFHTPRMFVYPAEEYAQKNPNAAEQLDRLQKILAGAALLEETLPIIPFFNATQQFAAQIKLIPFENGGGVRVLTQYAQYAAPINNRELFYHFEGLTSDGQYYVIAILPITAPILAEDENPEASVPEGGVPIPTAIGPNEVYYFSVTEKLNSLSQDAFTPQLNALDALIQSISVKNP
jgi:hypothetical protein